MATYPTPPGPRIAYDDPDFGAAAVLLNGTTSILAEAPAGAMASMNDPTTGSQNLTGGTGASNICLLLPEPYDLVAFLAASNRPGGGNGSPNLEYSTDTTNGVDGTWSTPASPGSAHLNWLSSDSSVARSSIYEEAVSGVVGMRFGSASSITFLTLYGTQSTPHGLKLWDPSSDVALDHSVFDTEDTLDTDVNDVTFRVKNLDGVSKANVTLTMEERNPNLGFDDMHQIDTGSGFGAFPANIGTLSAGQISSVITVRQTIDDTQLGLAWARLKVDAD